jgi:GAF domain-containing protein
MKRRSRVSGERAKAQRSNALKLKNLSTMKQAARRTSSAARKVARLIRDLEEAREQQRATSNVLRAMSQSEYQLQAVLQSVAETAARLSRSDGAVIFQLGGGVYRFAAGYSLGSAYLEIEREAIIFPGPDTLIGRAAMTRNVARIDDAFTDPLYGRKDDAKIEGNRSMIGVPLMREGEPVVVIGLARRRVDPFGDREIELATTFATQALIAIENARLLNELRQRTADLSEALEQQRATSDLLQVISGFPGDLEPIFQTMLAKAVGICGANFGNMFLYEDNAFRAVAMYNAPEAYVKARTSAPFSRPPDSGLGRLVATKEVVQIADLKAEEGYANGDPFIIAGVELAGIRTLLAVPMVKEGRLIGCIVFYRPEVRPFTDRQIELVKGFAKSGHHRH